MEQEQPKLTHYQKYKSTILKCKAEYNKNLSQEQKEKQKQKQKNYYKQYYLEHKENYINSSKNGNERIKKALKVIKNLSPEEIEKIINKE